MADRGGFVYVNYGRKGRKGKGRMRNQTPLPFADSLQRTRDELVSSGWWESYRAEIVPRIRQRRSVLGSGDTNGDTDRNEAATAASRWRCLCLGLGPPTTSEIARAQLCVLVDLCAELGIAPEDTEVFDPAFEEQDKVELRGLGLEVSRTNKKGSYVIDEETLVFMPHCGVKLYERFLRANWTEEGMGRIILVGNDLGAYVESTPRRKIEARSPCVARIAPHLQSTPFPPNTKLPGAFNNTSLQVLDRGSVSDKDSWTAPPETEMLGSSDEDGSDGEVR